MDTLSSGNWKSGKIKGKSVRPLLLFAVCFCICCSFLEVSKASTLRGLVRVGVTTRVAVPVKVGVTARVEVPVQVVGLKTRVGVPVQGGVTFREGVPVRVKVTSPVKVTSRVGTPVQVGVTSLVAVPDKVGVTARVEAPVRLGVTARVGVPVQVGVTTQVGVPLRGGVTFPEGVPVRVGVTSRVGVPVQVGVTVQVRVPEVLVRSSLLARLRRGISQQCEVSRNCTNFPDEACFDAGPNLTKICIDCKVEHFSQIPECASIRSPKDDDTAEYIVVGAILGIVVLLTIVGAIIGSCYYCKKCPFYKWNEKRKRMEEAGAMASFEEDENAPLHRGHTRHSRSHSPRDGYRHHHDHPTHPHPHRRSSPHTHGHNKHGHAIHVPTRSHSVDRPLKGRSASHSKSIAKEIPSLSMSKTFSRESHRQDRKHSRGREIREVLESRRKSDGV